MKRIILLCHILLVIGISAENIFAAEEYSYSDFSIQIPEDWKALERGGKGNFKSWLFGKQATENESGVSVAIYINTIEDYEFSSDEDLILTKDRWLNKNLNTMGKNKRVLNTSVIYDEFIDGENFRAANFRSLFVVANQPELNLRIYGRVYLTILGSRVITVNFQASENQEKKTKPQLEKIVETIKWVRE